MPLISKEKFTVGGRHKGATTTMGDIEINLYYDVREDYFFFRQEDMQEVVFLHTRVNFRDCKTRRSAIGLFELILQETLIETRFIELKIEVHQSVCKARGFRDLSSITTIDDVPINKAVMGLIGNFYATSGLSLSFRRVIKLQSVSSEGLVEATENWKYNRSNICPVRDVSHLLPWDAQLENYLLELEKKLNDIAKNLLLYLNKCDTPESIANLLKNNPLLGLQPVE